MTGWMPGPWKAQGQTVTANCTVMAGFHWFLTDAVNTWTDKGVH